MLNTTANQPPYRSDMTRTDASVNRIALPAADFERFAAQLDDPAELVPALVEFFQRTSRIPDPRLDQRC